MIAEPRSIYVSLRGDAVQALVDLAVTEHRHPREQAAHLIEAALEAQGLLGPHPRRAQFAEPPAEDPVSAR